MTDQLTDTPLPGAVKRGGDAPITKAEFFTNWQARVFEQGRWVRYEIRRPSGGGTVSKGYRTYKGATLAMRASLQRTWDRHLAALPTLSEPPQ